MCILAVRLNNAWNIASKPLMWSLCFRQLIFRWGKFGAIRIRTGNGAQFIAHLVRDYCTDTFWLQVSHTACGLV
jgi:hypothetical protein